MKSYRFYGDEAEILGNRLDYARKMATESKSFWAKNYWSKNVERLLFQWRQLPVLHDGDAQMTMIPRWTVDYEFYERQQERGLYGVSDRIYDRVFRNSVDLNTSWENNRAARLARAQY